MRAIHRYIDQREWCPQSLILLFFLHTPQHHTYANARCVNHKYRPDFAIIDTFLESRVPKRVRTTTFPTDPRHNTYTHRPNERRASLTCKAQPKTCPFASHKPTLLFFTVYTRQLSPVANIAYYLCPQIESAIYTINDPFHSAWVFGFPAVVIITVASDIFPPATSPQTPNLRLTKLYSSDVEAAPLSKWCFHPPPPPHQWGYGSYNITHDFPHLAMQAYTSVWFSAFIIILHTQTAKTEGMELDGWGVGLMLPNELNSSVGLRGVIYSKHAWISL